MKSVESFLSQSSIRIFATGAAILIMVTVTTGCQSIDVRGQFVSDSAIADINARKPSQNEVIEMVGTPTYVPEYSPSTWYYIQRSMAKRAWFDPKVIEQKIVKIDFNSHGKVLEATLLVSEHVENLRIENQYTKSVGTEKSNLQKFVKNIGRFNKTTDGKKKRQKKQS